MSKHLRTVRWVVVDEVHEIAEDKRGTQLVVELERLRRIAGEFQIAGLSATVGNPEEVAQFLVGVGRTCQVIDAWAARGLRLELAYPDPETLPRRRILEMAARLGARPEVVARLVAIRRVLNRRWVRSAIVFTNTRATAEVLSSRFKIWDLNYPIGVHHGSLGKEHRVKQEEMLREGKLKAVVATSSLELGIDIGHLDVVIQYGSPHQVTRLLQRVGRSGHRLVKDKEGEELRPGTARGFLVAMDPDDLLECVVLIRRAYAKELEPIQIPEKPFDVLVQQIAGMLLERRRWNVDEMLTLLRRAYPFRNLSKKELVEVIKYMHNKVPRLAWFAPEDEVVLRPRTGGIYQYYFDTLSMIPDTVNYVVINEADESAIGVLDEVFVSEAEPGTKFILRGAPWILTRVSGRRVYVKPAPDPYGAIPHWVGEELPVPYEVAMEVGSLLAELENAIDQGLSLKAFAETIARRNRVFNGRRYAIEEVKRGLKRFWKQASKGIPLPTHRRITVEQTSDGTIVVGLFGGTRANQTLARMVSKLLADQLGVPVGTRSDPFRIFVFGEEFDAEDVAQALRRLSEVSDERVAEFVVKALEDTGLFRYRMLQVAKKMGAVHRDADFTRVSVQRVLRALKGTVIYEEAKRVVLNQDADLMAVVDILRRIREGEFEICILPDGTDSEFAMIGIELQQMRADVVKPERMRRVIIEATKARVLDTWLSLACLECKHVWSVRVVNAPEWVTCPKCGSRRIGVSDLEEEEVKRILERKRRSRSEEREYRRMEFAADLVERYGKLALAALAGRGITPYDAAYVLEEHTQLDDAFFAAIAEMEREALKRRFTW